MLKTGRVLFSLSSPGAMRTTTDLSGTLVFSALFSAYLQCVSSQLEGIAPRPKGCAYDSSTKLVDQLAMEKYAILLPGFVSSV